MRKFNTKTKFFLMTVSIIILLPFAWWFSFGAGVPVVKGMLGIGQYNDGSHHLYMTEEQIKESMTPEQYENWKNRMNK